MGGELLLDVSFFLFSFLFTCFLERFVLITILFSHEGRNNGSGKAFWSQLYKTFCWQVFWLG